MIHEIHNVIKFNYVILFKVNLHYPSLLEEDKEINFYLKFRQFIELIAGTGMMPSILGDTGLITRISMN